MILATSESPCCRKPSIKFLLKRIYGLEENVGWWIPRWLLSAKQSLICLLFLSLHVARSLPSSFCSRGYMVWKMLVEEFQDGCFSAWQSTVCKLDDFCYFWVSMLLEASHQNSAQEDIWFGRRCWLKNSKMAA